MFLTKKIGFIYSGLSMILKDYQIEAIEQIMKNKGRVIKLPAGTGKSQILYECIKRVSGSILIIAPKYVLIQHIPQILKLKPNADLITPNYLVLHVDKFIDKKYDLICIDESHIIKNLRAKCSKAAMLLAELNLEAIKICLTATPYRENIAELYPQVYFVNPQTQLGTKKEFVKRYEKSVLCGSYWKKEYILQQEILNIASRDIYTKQVPMPKQIIKDIILDMPQDLREYYTKAKKECWIMVQDKPLFFTAALWVKLQQICSGFTCQTVKDDPILLSKHKWQEIKEIADSINDTVIIWSNMRFELQQLSKLIPEAGLVMGRIKCDKAIEDFKKGKLRILIANPSCIGAGLSFECCHYQILSSIDYSGIKYYQTLKRTNRITQQHQEIIYRVYYHNTIQERIYKALESKEKLDEEFMRTITMKEISS